MEGDKTAFTLSAFHPLVTCHLSLSTRSSPYRFSTVCNAPSPPRVVQIRPLTPRQELRSPSMLTTDYMSLLKVDGRWVIVNKIFSRTAAKGHAAGK
ncbi:MAG: nuclear transport factor 2 family protein [Gaiellales bacterium]